MPALLDSYYRAMTDAEDAREVERASALLIQRMWRGYSTRRWLHNQHECACMIQKTYRGYIARRAFEALVSAHCYTTRMRRYNRAATLIQKIWRGTYTRRRIFDYAARKAYIRTIEARMRDMRTFLAHQASDDAERAEARTREARMARMTALMGTMHHLVGTKAIPSALRGADEAAVKDSPAVREWVRRNVERKTLPSIVSEDGRTKAAQGPFLPLAKLEKRKQQVFRPSLRVQTGYYDTDEAAKDEKARELSMRISPTFYVSVQHSTRPAKNELWRASEPYQPPVTSVQRLADKEERQTGPGKRPFKHLARPVALFDEYNY
ncbi:hypothetical protein SeMB42_g00281 [Synchytrium endobioticum]|nr:hypothetical protein SeMB42_g00281 [Synchytrium endobioticum]